MHRYSSYSLSEYNTDTSIPSPVDIDNIDNIVYPIFSDEKNTNIEDEFQKKFDQFSNNIIPPVSDESNHVSSWNDLCEQIEKFINKKINEYYGENFINELEDIKNNSDHSDHSDPSKNIKEFEKKLEKLVSKRSNLLKNTNIISEIFSEKQIVNDVDDMDDVDVRIKKKYDLNIADVRYQINNYEKVLLLIVQELKEKKQCIEKYHDDIFNIKKWIYDIPDSLKNNNNLTIIHDTVISQLKKYIEEHHYIKLLDDYKKSYVEFLYIVSHCDNFFRKSNKCTICLINDITHTLSPCGHCYCIDCSNKIQRNKCHICRQSVNTKVKLHL